MFSAYSHSGAPIGPQVRDAGIQRVVGMLQMEMRLIAAEKRDLQNTIQNERLAMSYRVGAEVCNPNSPKPKTTNPNSETLNPKP
jgi:hypothetical protein